MLEEGMVHALRRAHQWLRPGGCLIDLHPTAGQAAVEVDTLVTGDVDVDDGPRRHAAAGAALIAVVDAGVFVVEHATEFTFFTYGDTLEELREYVEENWRSARFGAAVIERTSRALRAAPGVRPRVRERVQLTRLRPLTPASPRVPLPPQQR